MSLASRDSSTRDHRMFVLIAVVLAECLSLPHATAAEPLDRDHRTVQPMLVDNIDRPLRYNPEDGDFVITNGREFFNRPLYGGSSAFRVDAGDRPEFSLYLPGRGGNLRLGIRTAAGTKWLHDVANIVARYRPGSMMHEICDPLLGQGTLRITALAPHTVEGLILKIDARDIAEPMELVVAFGGINGDRGSRDGDIGTERLPVREFFQLRPEYCRDNEVTLGDHVFVVRGKGGSIVGVLPTGTTSVPLDLNGAALAAGDAEPPSPAQDPRLAPCGSLRSTTLCIADATAWDKPAELFSGEADQNTDLPVVAGRVPLSPGRPVFVALQNMPSKQTGSELLATYREAVAERELRPAGTNAPALWTEADLPELYARTEAERQAIAERVAVQTPDPYLDTAVAALNIAADGVWDDRQSAYLHGGVAWRARLLGWRVSYAGDALGWHERTRAHFDSYATRQNTDPIADAIPKAEASANLARNETALHSNGDMTRSHYDMNLVGVDAFFRHLLWTGDLDYARRMWPVIERHLAWERRLFRREYGPEKLPLYEAYCCIWASDAVAYNGGGTAHSTAYNFYHNCTAARVARLIGADPAIYEREAALIGRAMREYLWLPDRGWFGEYRDLLGLQRIHPNAASWTFYHTVDSEVPSKLESWQMTRFVDTQLPHIPVRGPGVPAGNYTVPTTTWTPYAWSVNNVVLAESVHTALALWQAGRADAAYPLLKGALLDSMYLGICPGNVGMATWYDVNRRESQRDFGDGVGTLSRTVVEGVFGVNPDLLKGEVRLRPGFPADWDRASIHHPDFDFTFTRQGDSDRYEFQSRFARHVGLRLQVVARRDAIDAVTVNGQPAEWRVLADSVGVPKVEIETPATAEHTVEITWRGRIPAAVPIETVVARGIAFQADAGAPITEYADPQGVLNDPRVAGNSLLGTVVGTAGHRTVFARVTQGRLVWWQPLMLEVREARPETPQVFTTDWNRPVGPAAKLESVPLAAVFNDQVAKIFSHEYLTPRSPFVSLAIPKQGFGRWTGPADTFVVDDSGLRSAAAKGGDHIELPNGVGLVTPGTVDVPNIAFMSRWDNFPCEIDVPLSGYATKIYLLMAGSTGPMQSRFDNGELIVAYADGSATRLALENPTTWWPIDQDYFVDDFAYVRQGAFPVRVDLKTGKIRVLDTTACQTGRRAVVGGAATVLDFSLDPSKELKSLTVRALANEVVIGLMSATLQRP